MLGIDFEKFAALGKSDRPKLVASEERKELRQNDVQLWHDWNNNGRKPEDLRPLLNNFRGMIRGHANKFTRNVEIPPAAIHQECREQFLKAVETYDPEKGHLGTWISEHLKKTGRYVAQNQNFARIMGDRAENVGKYKAAVAHLTDQLGREPSHHEVADHLNWSMPELVKAWTVPEVKRMHTELTRKSNIASMYEADPIDVLPAKEKEWLTMVYYELTPEEQIVYDHLQGTHGKPVLKQGEIAKILNTSGSTVTRIKKNIAEKIKKYMV